MEGAGGGLVRVVEELVDGGIDGGVDAAHVALRLANLEEISEEKGREADERGKKDTIQACSARSRGPSAAERRPSGRACSREASKDSLRTFSVLMRR